MANSHVLEQTQPGKYRVVHHLPIPAANNPAGISYQVVIAAEVAARVEAGGRASALPNGDGTAGTISPAEKAQIVSGAIYELVREEKGQTTASAANIYALRSADILADLQTRYAQYGRTV